MKKHICLVFGGSGIEREVSITSASYINNALLELGYKVTKLDFDENFIENITKIKPDLVFNAMHGMYGEDGTLPTLLNFLKIPYTHSGRQASIIGINKEITKQMAKSGGFSIISSNIYTKKQILEGTFKSFKKSFLKPCFEGSTLGCFAFNEETGLSQKDLQTLKSIPTDLFLIEEFYEGIEVTIAVLQEKAIGGIEIIPISGMYNYEAKYTKGKTEYFTPPRIDRDVLQQLMHVAESMHKMISAKTVSRSDFLVNGKDYRFLEINTHPGFTETSLVPKAASAIGITFKDLVDLLIKDASYEAY